MRALVVPILVLALPCTVLKADDSASAQAQTADTITKLTIENRHKISYDDQNFAGPGYERLLAEGIKADFFSWAK